MFLTNPGELFEMCNHHLLAIFLQSVNENVYPFILVLRNNYVEPMGGMLGLILQLHAEHAIEQN